MLEIPNNAATRKTVLWRGICCRCPNCGTGALFSSYLKQNNTCPVCGEDLSLFRAEDGPAWLTILLALHVIVPTAVFLASHDFFPEWVTVSLLFVFTILVTLLILPRAKGLFIVALWLLAKKKATASPVS